MGVILRYYHGSVPKVDGSPVAMGNLSVVLLREWRHVFLTEVQKQSAAADQSKTVEARIMQFSPHSSPIPLVFVR